MHPAIISVAEACEIAAWSLASSEQWRREEGLRLVYCLGDALRADAERRREAGEWRPE